MKTIERLKSELAYLRSDAEKKALERFENYRNCLDDYSYGSSLYSGTKDEIARLAGLISLMEEQEANGGHLIQSHIQYTLEDTEGNLVSDTVIDGRYGKAWKLNTLFTEKGRFMGVNVKPETYKKRGYIPVAIEYTLKVVYTGEMSDKGTFIRDIEIVDKKRITNFKLSDVKRMSKSLYFALRK